MDEGHLASAASWMLQGKLLYREIDTGIFPAIYYITALLFSIFEPDILVTRWAQVLLNLGVSLCLWRLAARVARAHWAALPPLLYLTLVVIGFPVLTMFNYSSVSTGFGLAALLFLLRYLESGRLREGVLVGLFLAACALTKQNFGAFAFLALAVALVWGRRGSALESRSWGAALAPIVAAGGAITLVALLHFVSTGTLRDLLDATVLNLWGSQLRSFNNPIPPLFGPLPLQEGRFVFLYAPPTVFNALMRGEPVLGSAISPFLLGMSIRLSYALPLAILATSPLLLWLARRSEAASQRRAERAIVSYALLFFLGIFPSCVWSHLAFVLAPSLVLIAILGDRIESVLLGRGPAAAWAWRGVLALGVAVAALSMAEIGSEIRRWYPVPSQIPQATLRLAADQAELLRGATEFVETCSDASDPIFVAPDIPLVYFLSGRSNPSPYDLLIPGNMDSELIIRRLEAEQTRCLVYNPRMYPEFPPFEELFPELSRYIHTKYRLSEIIQGGSNEWHGLVRRSEL
jgi:4-amino-4-deoxy-L-arabinose transferase-like glycosyltransferase